MATTTKGDWEAVEIGSVEAPQGFAEAVLRDLLGAFPHIRLRVSGACLDPEVTSGDTVHVARPALRPPAFGDIVLRRHPRGLRLHRVVWAPAAGLGAWRTRGDHSTVWDPALSPEDVLGTVVWIEGKGRPRPGIAGWKSLLVGLLARARAEFRPTAA
jgi:hypothetical protein